MRTDLRKTPRSPRSMWQPRRRARSAPTFPRSAVRIPRFAAPLSALIAVAIAAPLPAFDATAAPAAHGAASHPSARLARALGADRADHVWVARGASGALRFVSTTPGHPLARPSGAG